MSDRSASRRCTAWRAGCGYAPRRPAIGQCLEPTAEPPAFCQPCIKSDSVELDHSSSTLPITTTSPGLMPASSSACAGSKKRKQGV